MSDEQAINSIKENTIKMLEGTRMDPDRIKECRELLDTDFGRKMILVCLEGVKGYLPSEQMKTLTEPESER